MEIDIDVDQVQGLANLSFDGGKGGLSKTATESPFSTPRFASNAFAIISHNASQISLIITIATLAAGAIA